MRLGAGTLYHALGSLAKRGLVEETEPPSPEDAGSSRWRFYRITRSGRRVLALEVQRLAADVEFARGRIAAAEEGRS